MRLLTRRIYRAFPELDRFPDEACERFVCAARRGWATFVVHGLAGIGVIIPGLYLAFHVLYAALRWLQRWGDPLLTEDPGLFVTAAIFCGIVLGVPVLVALLVRDRLLRRRIGLVLRTRGTCNVCRYSLLGLPVSEACTVACPECGTVLTVDRALGELADQGGVKTFSPKAANEDIAPPLFDRHTWRRIARWTLVSAVVAVMLLAGAWGVFELWMRRQSAFVQQILSEVERKSIEAASDQGVWTKETIVRKRLLTEAYVSALEAVQQAERTCFTDNPGLVMASGSHTPAFGLWCGVDSPHLYHRTREESERLIAMVEPMLVAYREGGVLEAMENAAAILRSAPRTDASLSVFPGIPNKASYAQHQVPVALAAMFWQAYLDRDLARATRVLEVMLQFERAFDYFGHIGWSSMNFTLHANAILLNTLGDAPSREWVEMIEAGLRRREPLEYMLRRSEVHHNTLHYIFQQHPSPGAARSIYYDAFVNWIRRGAWKTSNGSPLPDPYADYEGFRKYADFDQEHFAKDRWQRPLYPKAGAITTAMLPGVLVADLDMSLAWYDYSRLQQRALEVLLALAHHRLDTGSYPATLEELAPARLAVIPRDPWADRPLTYRRCEPNERADGRPYVLYAVGPNGTDDRAVKDCSEGGVHVLTTSVSFRLPDTIHPADSDFILNPAPRRKPSRK